MNQCVLCALVLLVVASSAYKVTVTDLGVEPGLSMSAASTLFGSNLAAGSSFDDFPPYKSDAFRVDLATKRLTGLGPLAGRHTRTGPGRIANDAGQIAGYSVKPGSHYSPSEDLPAPRPRTSMPIREHRAFVWSNGTFDDIGGRFGWNYSVSTGINSGGLVSGSLLLHARGFSL